MGRRRDVRATYDRIAAHFAETRSRPWSEVEEFLADRTGDVGLDLGCGNGRHATLLADRTDVVVTVDLSRACLEETAARATGYEPIRVQADAASIPLRTGRVDLGVYVATIHHLETRDLRIRSLDELARVLVPGGAAIVSAWSVSHDTFDRSAAFDTTVDWTLPDGETVPRFYHVYDSEEFRDDLSRSDLVVERAFESEGNCYGVVKG